MSEATEQDGAPSEDEDASPEDEDTEKPEEPVEIDDFIPSEAISEDLAVDMPIDI